MVPPAASKFFQLFLKISQVAEVCVEEIKIQTLLVIPVVLIMVPLKILGGLSFQLVI